METAKAALRFGLSLCLQVDEEVTTACYHENREGLTIYVL